MVPLFIAVGAFLAILLVIVGIASPRPADRVQDRLQQYDRLMTLEEMELARPFSERVLLPTLRAISGFVSRFTPQRTLENTQHKLDLAGNPNNWSAAEFLGIRALSALLLGALAFALLMLVQADLTRQLLYSAVMLLLGYFLPVAWLGSRIRNRQDEIVRTLPDALDLLTISVEAGLPFDGAMQRVADKWDNELSRGFQRLLTEMQVGKSRREALRDMAGRMEVPDVTSFVAALTQADQLGISIAKVLRIQAEQMRIKRRQRAEEKAQQAPIKMLIPMTFLIFPTILIVILGPALLILKESAIFSVF